jgi:hypothetical protein
MVPKKFQIKVFEPDGVTFIKSLTSIQSGGTVLKEPKFSLAVNGGLGECRIPLKTDKFEIFDEGGAVSFMNVVKIYEIDSENKEGRLIYTGYIEDYEPYADESDQGVDVVCLGLVSTLALDKFESGGSFEVSVVSQDPAVVWKMILDHFIATWPNPLIDYDVGGTTIDTVGTPISYDFNGQSWLDALGIVFGLVGSGWYYYFDKEGIGHLKPKPVTATHRFTFGKDIESVDVTKSSREIVNKCVVQWASGEETYSDAPSIAAYGQRTSIVSDSAIKDATSAQQRAEQEVNDNKDPKIKVRLVINSKYDIESIKPGDTCRITNVDADQALFSDNMFIVKVTYELDRATLELEGLAADFATEILS